MGNVPPAYTFIKNLCGGSYEMGFPKGADMKPPRESFIPLGGSFLTSSLEIQKYSNSTQN
jgi:hypothetical protein